MAKRVKSDKPYVLPIISWRHADDYIRRIGNCTIEIANAERCVQEDINQIKAKLTKKVKHLQEKRDVYVDRLETFAAIYKNDFEKQKSRKLNFGIIGWRKSTSISITKKTLELIRQVFSKAKAAACIRVKGSVDKEALARLKDEDLALVKAQRKSKEVFFVEPDLTEAADY